MKRELKRKLSTFLSIIMLLMTGCGASTAAVTPDTGEDIQASIQDDTVALDMEGYALATVADMMDTKWLVIKTVQDFADGNKSATEGDVRPYAAYSSAKLLKIILEKYAFDEYD